MYLPTLANVDIKITISIIPTTYFCILFRLNRYKHYCFNFELVGRGNFKVTSLLHFFRGAQEFKEKMLT